MVLITTDNIILTNGKILIEENTSANIASAITSIAVELEEIYSVEVDTEIKYEDNSMNIRFCIDRDDYIEFQQIATNAYHSATGKHYRIFKIIKPFTVIPSRLHTQVLEDYFDYA